MTNEISAKEYAIELCRLYMVVLDHIVVTKKVKQCALIAISKIIDSEPLEPFKLSYYELVSDRVEDVKEFIVGMDALAVFVHPSNPIDGMTLEEVQRLIGLKGIASEIKGVPYSIERQIVEVEEDIKPWEELQ
jgi:hypothetical protein